MANDIKWKGNSMTYRKSSSLTHHSSGKKARASVARKAIQWQRAVLVAILLASVGVRAAAEETTPAWDRPLPFFADWAVERGIELPNPFGVSLFMIMMSRDIKVTDVRVTLPGDEPVSVSDVASFEVRNHTTMAALKVDTWVLPLLNVYFMGGQTYTDSRLDAAVTVDPRFGPPVTFDLEQNTQIKGPMFGGGATAVGGYGPWFAMVDANYSYADIQELDKGIGALFVSTRTGWSGAGPGTTWRVWVGAAWIRTDRTLTITQESSLGPVKLEVDQEPVNPMTFELGYSLGFSKRWELMLELGSNFADAALGVFSLAYRF
jgi:hypothetical protein